MTWLRTKMVRDMMLPDYANNAYNEIVQLSNDLMKFLSQNDIKSEILLNPSIGNRQRFSWLLV